MMSYNSQLTEARNNKKEQLQGLMPQGISKHQGIHENQKYTNLIVCV